MVNSILGDRRISIGYNQLSIIDTNEISTNDNVKNNIVIISDTNNDDINVFKDQRKNINEYDKNKIKHKISGRYEVQNNNKEIFDSTNNIIKDK